MVSPLSVKMGRNHSCSTWDDGNEALVQNGLLFKFLMVGFVGEGCWGDFSILFPSLSPQSLSETSLYSV